MSRSRILLVLVVVLAGALYYAWWATPTQQRVSDSELSNRPVAGSPRTKVVIQQNSELNFSGGEKLAFKEPKRDLFRPLYRRPAVKRPPPPPPKPKPVRLPPPPPVITRPTIQQPVGPKSIPNLTVLGYLQKENKFTVFLASAQGDVYLVQKGDRFGDDLLLRDINRGVVTVSRGMDDPGRTFQFRKVKTQRLPKERIVSDRPKVPELNFFDPKAKQSAPAPRPAAPGAGKTSIAQ